MSANGSDVSDGNDDPRPPPQPLAGDVLQPDHVSSMEYYQLTGVTINLTRWVGTHKKSYHTRYVLPRI